MGARLLHNRCTQMHTDGSGQSRAEHRDGRMLDAAAGGRSRAVLCPSKHSYFKIHDFVCILGLLIWGSFITCGSQVFGQQTG